MIIYYYSSATRQGRVRVQLVKSSPSGKISMFKFDKAMHVTLFFLVSVSLVVSYLFCFSERSPQRLVLVMQEAVLIVDYSTG